MLLAGTDRKRNLRLSPLLASLECKATTSVLSYNLRHRWNHDRALAAPDADVVGAELLTKVQEVVRGRLLFASVARVARHPAPATAALLSSVQLG